jgi:hypothetical protein
VQTVLHYNADRYIELLWVYGCGQQTWCHLEKLWGRIHTPETSTEKHERKQGMIERMQRDREKELNKFQRKEAREWVGKWKRGMNKDWE